MAAVVALGLGFGASAFLLFRALFPAPPPLGDALAALRPATGTTGPPGVEGPLQGWRERTGAALLAAFEARGFSPGRRRADLRVLGRTVERHVLDKAVAAAALATLSLAAGTVASLAGLSVTPAFLGVVFVVLGVLGFLAPDLTLHSEAERRRREFRFALTHYLEVAVVVLAAGGGVETALYEAADAGDGWPHRELRRTLGSCRLSGTSPWDALWDLADELAVPQLSELAASMSLAGEHGAKVRASLADYAATLRDDQLAEVTEAANVATETMSVPVVGLLFSFLGFVTYPALARIFFAL